MPEGLTSQRNTSHKYRYEQNSNPPLGGLQRSSLTNVLSEYPYFCAGDTAPTINNNVYLIAGAVQ